ncbi:hypothetical protein H0H93_008656 [Arthromyces matolae]|nr:hypothetical protein H0H93_008656 [Arthromyces matolae]
MSSDWLPAWAKEGREPDFMEPGSSGPSYTSFGHLKSAYLWGNLPAIDCLNLPHNEGSSAKMKDFKLCFGVPLESASGDLRNLIRTVNGLPEDYAGQCDILFNDINPLVVGHNIVVLWALLNPGLEQDEAAELALHLMYSSMLTSSMSDFLSRSLSVLHDFNRGRHFSVATVGEGKLIIMLRPGDLDVTIEMLQSRYGQSAAANSYSSMMCNPSRRDYSDRYLNSLEPAHRLAFTHYRSLGILAPFSLDTSTFCEPNR